MKSLTMLILGGTGDLAKKKLFPALNVLIKNHFLDRIDVISTGRRDFTNQQYSEFIGAKSLGLDKNIVLHYFRADFTVKDSLSGLKGLFSKIEDDSCIGRIYYLATSPEFFKSIASQLALLKGDEAKIFNRIMIEKPFGYDLKSSRLLGKSLTGYFDEEQIFRVDHYLGKEAIQNILVLRLSNPFFERTWNSEFIEKIEITVSEDMGVGERLAYYDGSGAIRDMIQNHLMQVASFILMDAPKSTSYEHIHEAKSDAIKRLEFSGDMILGQYEGYDDELKKAGLKKTGSDTETFVDLRLQSSAKRWNGTKISLKTGKMLNTRYAKIEIYYKKEPCVLYCDISTYPNKLVLNIQPKQDIDFFMNTKVPQSGMDIKHVSLNFSRDKEFKSNTPESYEVVLQECINGDRTLFISDKELEASWKLIDKIRGYSTKMKPRPYAMGSAGP